MSWRKPIYPCWILWITWAWLAWLNSSFPFLLELGLWWSLYTPCVQRCALSFFRHLANKFYFTYPRGKIPKNSLFPLIPAAASHIIRRQTPFFFNISSLISFSAKNFDSKIIIAASLETFGTYVWMVNVGAKNTLREYVFFFSHQFS